MFNNFFEYFRTFLMFLIKGALVVATTTLITTWAHHRGLLAPVENLCFEVSQLMNLERLLPGGPPPKDPLVRIVAIGETDHQTRFQSRTPLDSNGVKALVSAICAGKPKVIIVDLDTAHWDDPASPPVSCDAPIFWARGLRTKATRTGMVTCADKVLGGRQGIGNQFAPIASVVKDPDGVVRRYSRTVMVLPSCDGSSEQPVEYPTVLDVVPNFINPHLPRPQEVVMDFFSNLYDLKPIPAEVVRDAAKGDGWPVNGPLTGRVVILGGTYFAARDQHSTPVGAMSGLQLLGQALSTSLDGKGIQLWAEIRLISLEILFGYLLLAYHRCSNYRVPLSVTVAVFGVVSFIISSLVMSTFALWPNFIPIFIGVTLHELLHEASRKHAD